MKKVLQGTSDIWPKQPEGIVGAQVCATSGLLPPNDGDDKGCATRFEYFIRGTVPNRREAIKQAVMIDKATGDLAAPGQTDNVEAAEHMVLSDDMSTYCLDCPHPEGRAVIIQ